MVKRSKNFRFRNRRNLALRLLPNSSKIEYEQIRVENLEMAISDGERGFSLDRVRNGLGDETPDFRAGNFCRFRLRNHRLCARLLAVHP